MTMKLNRAYYAKENIRVQIPAYTDMWMRGDRFGTIVNVKTRNMLDPRDCSIASIKLDKSGKTIRVFLDDCTNV